MRAVDRAREAGVARIITIGTGIDSCRRALAARPSTTASTRRSGSIRTRPGRRGRPSSTSCDELLRAHPDVVAVGETGLDYHYGADRNARTAPALRRAARLRGEARLARRRPHALGQRRTPWRCFGTIPGRSSCTASRSRACSTPALEHGWYVSFAGNVTYPKARRASRGRGRDPRRPDPRRDRQPVPRAAARARPAQRAGQRRPHASPRSQQRAGKTADELAAQIDANATAAFRLP